MASVINGNSFYIDSTSASGTAGSFLQDKDIQVVYIIFNPHSSGDTVTIHDIDSISSTVSAGAKKFLLKGSGNTPVILNFSENSVRFPNGIWISQISTSSNCTIIFNRRG